ncbi:MAG: OmpA family protein [bacterium]
MNNQTINAFCKNRIYRLIQLTIIATTVFSISCAIFTGPSGLVEVSTVYGFVTDQEYTPVEGVEITIAGEEQVIALTNSAGYYIISDLAPGDYNLIFARPNYESKTISINIKAGEKIELDQIMNRVEAKKGIIRGIVLDYLTNEPLVAQITIMELNRTVSSDNKGNFEFYDVPTGKYLLKVQALDYVTSQTDATVTPDKPSEQVIRIFREGSIIVLEGVEFEFNSAKLKPESYPVLDNAAMILTKHPEIDVEIQGHTDNIGSEEYNKKLSQKRAEAVQQYLIDKHMIEPVRLIPIGYGESCPVADNSTEQGRQKNRRVEFFILEHKPEE